MGLYFDIWGAIAPRTVFDEVSSFREDGNDPIQQPGPLVIVWRCRRCGKRIEIPEQQNFRYCIHCGAKVTIKILR